MWACCNSSLSHWQSVWALQLLSEVQTGLFWPLYDMALHKISGKELSASWHLSTVDFFKPKAPLAFSASIVRGVLMSHWSQELHGNKKHSIRSPPHNFSSLLRAPHLSLVPISWWLWLRLPLQGSWLACTPSCAIRLSPPFLHGPFNSGSCSPFLWAATFLPASPSCSSKRFPPPHLFTSSAGSTASQPHPEKPSCPFPLED